MDSVIKFEGALEKTSRLFKNKTSIWMVIEGLSITHYKSSTKTFCVGSIDVNEVQTARLTGHKKGREFEVTTKTTSYTFTAETSELADAWVKVIQQSMLRKSSESILAETSMSSSDYAEICDVSPAKNTSSGSSKIYEDLEELEKPREKNIFGVQLKPSINKSERPGSRSVFDSRNNEKRGTKANPERVAAAVKTEEPIYAQPDKSKATSTATTNDSIKKAESTEVQKGPNQPKPSFSPPPPPAKAYNIDNITSTMNTYTPESKEQVDVGQKTKYKISDPYEQIDVDFSTIKKEKNEMPEERPSGESGTIADIDDDHEYYMADPVVDMQDQEAAAGTDKDMVTDDNAIGNAAPTNTETTTETEVEVRSKASRSANAYDEVDLSQVVRRTRGSHVTESFSEDSSSQVVRRTRGSHVTESFSEDSPSQPKATERPSVRNGSRASGGQSKVSVRRQNFRDSRKTEEEMAESEEDEANDVFTGEEESTPRQQKAFDDNPVCVANLKAVVEFELNSNETSGVNSENVENGKAFLTLKQYLERHSKGGFDLETHTVTSRNSIEKLQALLSS